MKAIYAILIGSALVSGCSALNREFGLPDDNPIEETVEAEIESVTGLDIDLTPASPEGIKG